jgi:DNA-binding LacI/PurR family transcriptional regulator
LFFVDKIHIIKHVLVLMALSRAKEDMRSDRVEGTAGLARHLGLSRWTVSRVLNGHSGVSEATRNRVVSAVRELGFEPNHLARGLRGVRSGLVGISFPHLEAIVLARKSQALQAELKGLGYRSVFAMPEGDSEKEEAVVRHFLSINVEGIVLIGSVLEADSPVFGEAMDRGVNIVAVDARSALPIPRVSLDRGKAMLLKLKHLYDLGHRRIAVCGLQSDDMYQSVRKRGLGRAVEELQLREGKDLIYVDEPGYDQQSYAFGSLLARRVLDMGRCGPTALFCLNDRIAIGALKGLQEGGGKIPEDYSVIGLDNLPESAWTYPSLTTVDQNIESLMEAACKLLEKGCGLRTVKKVEPILKIRSSTGPVRKDNI